MTKWELAKYLIDAKKDIDSILYCSLHGKEARFIDLKSKIELRKADFYINCCVVLDNAFDRKEKKNLCSKYRQINDIYYQRDKNSAHKDYNYKETSFNDLNELVALLEDEIQVVRNVCKDSLPEQLTLDFVPHDRETFRMINGIANAEIEEKILKQKHPFYKQSSDGGKAVVTNALILQDISQLRNMPEEEKKKYCTIVDAGINSYEGLQNRQDWMIKTNCLSGSNMWVTPNSDSFKKMEILQQLGIYDQFEIFHPEALKDERVQKELDKLFKEDLRNG